ncbi:MAG: DNA-binding protein [Clostridiales bacterium]|nr:DNA-binding protein [Clostridiales bacterium]
MYEKLLCCKCETELVMKKVNFSYLGHNFFTEVPACPVCGQVYVSEQLAKGKMAEVEKNLEEK